MPRLRGFERKNPPTFNQLQGLHEKLSFACPDARDQRFHNGALRAARAIGTGFQQCCRKIDAHFHRSTFVRIGSERRPRAGRDAGKAHGRCSEIERRANLAHRHIAVAS